MVHACALATWEAEARVWKMDQPGLYSKVLSLKIFLFVCLLYFVFSGIIWSGLCMFPHSLESVDWTQRFQLLLCCGNLPHCSHPEIKNPVHTYILPWEKSSL